MKPDERKYAIAKRRLRHFLRKIIGDLEELQADIAWWNEHRTDAAPFDAGGDLVAAHLARQVLDCVESDRLIPDELWDRLNVQLAANAKPLL
jgi:hypothetical protein